MKKFSLVVFMVAFFIFVYDQGKKVYLEKSKEFNLLNSSYGETGYTLPILPTIGSYISRGPNNKHAGVDIATKIGTPIFAAADGFVLAIKKDPNGYGLYVIVKHPKIDGEETLYAHLSKIMVYKNQSIKAKQQIGLSGKSGNATAPLLHFEVGKKLGTSESRIFHILCCQIIKSLHELKNNRVECPT